ncbi:MAG: bifunctional UDP-N-acetylglucosamine diphosphorylase/glucosamine-1-phosphate N-acetyltransferase GlmU [Rickettsiales bacterium]
MTSFACVILAAGKGTRMKSTMPKVMHEVAGMPMINHVITTVSKLNPDKKIVVIADHMESVKESVKKIDNKASFAIQHEQLGTAHAVSQTKEYLSSYSGKVLILYGDTPLITSDTLERMLEKSVSAEVTVLGMRLTNPYGYGRLLLDEKGHISEIIEEKDANDAQKKINLCNSGVMVVSGKYLFDILSKITPNNKAGEYYLTDIIALAGDMNLHCSVVEADASELSGVNSRAQLAEAESVIQNRLRKNLLDSGVTMTDPSSVYLRGDTRIAPDVIIHPNVVFGEEVNIEGGVLIKSFSHIEGAHIKSGAVVGPFARLRKGSVVGNNANIGNFVELKNTTLGDNAKANHLSYVGDSEVGNNANIGAGTITCNYDGVNKHKTIIGEGAFIGSNSSLVAPVKIGNNSITGAGSVITTDVPENNLAIERSEQINKQKKVGK